MLSTKEYTQVVLESDGPRYFPLSPAQIETGVASYLMGSKWEGNIG